MDILDARSDNPEQEQKQVGGLREDSTLEIRDHDSAADTLFGDPRKQIER